MEPSLDFSVGFIVGAAYTRWPLTKRLPVTPLLAARFPFIHLLSNFSLSFFPSLVQGSKVNLTTISRFSKIRAIFHFLPSLRVGTGSWNSSPLLIHQKSSLHERICQEEEPSSVSHLTSLIPPPSKKEKLRESNEVSLSMRNNCKGNFFENGTFTPEPRGRIKEF